MEALWKCPLWSVKADHELLGTHFPPSSSSLSTLTGLVAHGVLRRIVGGSSSISSAIVWDLPVPAAPKMRALMSLASTYPCVIASSNISLDFSLAKCAVRNKVAILICYSGLYDTSFANWWRRVARICLVGMMKVIMPLWRLFTTYTIIYEKPRAEMICCVPIHTSRHKLFLFAVVVKTGHLICIECFPYILKPMFSMWSDKRLSGCQSI